MNFDAALGYAAKLVGGRQNLRDEMQAGGLRHIGRDRYSTRSGVDLREGVGKLLIKGDSTAEFNTRYGKGGEFYELGFAGSFSEDAKQTHIMLHEIIHVLQNNDGNGIYKSWINAMKGPLDYQETGQILTQNFWLC
jgi:hypothetical protein